MDEVGVFGLHVRSEPSCDEGGRVERLAGLEGAELGIAISKAKAVRLDRPGMLVRMGEAPGEARVGFAAHSDASTARA